MDRIIDNIDEYNLFKECFDKISQMENSEERIKEFSINAEKALKRDDFKGFLQRTKSMINQTKVSV